jgi:hypothetical protein
MPYISADRSARLNCNTSNYFSEVLQMKAALQSGEEGLIEQILDASSDVDALGCALRNAMLNYVSDIAGTSNTSNSTIWAMPVLFRDGANQFISTRENPEVVIDADLRNLIRSHLGAEYSVSSLDGVVHSEALSAMPLIDQSSLFGSLVGDERQNGKRPRILLTEEICSRVEEGLQPELCFVLGAMTRINRRPVISPRNQEDTKRFLEHVKGRLALRAPKRFPSMASIECGAPNELSIAYEQGVMQLITHEANAGMIAKPAVTATSANDFIIRYNVLDGNDRFYTRVLNLNRTWLDIDGIQRVYEHAMSLHTKVPERFASIGMESRRFH